MTKIKKLVPSTSLCLLPALGMGQTLDPAAILKPLSENWPTYSGDYSGMRHSKLTQINQSNVRNLTLAWTARVTGGAPAAGGGGFGGGRGGGAAAPTIIGGEGTGDTNTGGFGGGNVYGEVGVVLPDVAARYADSDSTETPILVDGMFNGRQRKMVLHASRNGYYFTLDRLTGERLVTSKYSDTINWAKGLDEKGRPVRDPAKDSTVPGSLVSPNNGGAANWPPPAYSPDTGLLYFYVPTNDAYAMYYLTETDPRGAMGLGGKEEAGLGSMGAYLTAIDYKTGKVAWQHRYPGTGGGLANGVPSTAGKLLFQGDLSGNLVAYDPANGKILWHTRLGQVSNAPETYMLDGHQYILIAAGDALYAFTLH